MDAKVLVAYASKYGATAEIAARVAEVLDRAGVPTDVLPVERVDAVTPYRAVVLGSAVYIGRWRKEAVRFLGRHEEALARRPLWIFVSGPTGDEEIRDANEGWNPTKKLQDLLDRVQPVDLTVFHGALDTTKLSGPERWIIKKVKAPVGDFRDWEAITAWATEVAAEVKEAAAQPA